MVTFFIQLTISESLERMRNKKEKKKIKGQIEKKREENKKS